MTKNQQEPDQNWRVTRSMTGAQYIESLRGGRNVYVYGERIRDVARHAALRNPVRMTALLYEALHDPVKAATLAATTDTGRDGWTSRTRNHGPIPAPTRAAAAASTRCNAPRS